MPTADRSEAGRYTSAAALETISGNHSGYLLITGPALGGDNEFLLKKYFLQILAGVSNAEVVLDPIGVISPRQILRIPFVICDQDNLADVILLAQERNYLQFLLETPFGQLVDPNAASAAGATTPTLPPRARDDAAASSRSSIRRTTCRTRRHASHPRTGACRAP